MHPIPTPPLPLPFFYPRYPAYPLLYSHLVRAGFRDELIGQVERFDRSRVGPPALQQIPGQCAIRDIGIVDVGNFKLTPPRWFESLDDIEYVRIIKIHARDRIRRSGVRRFLFDLDDPISFKNRHPEP